MQEFQNTRHNLQESKTKLSVIELHTLYKVFSHKCFECSFMHVKKLPVQTHFSLLSDTPWLWNAVVLLPSQGDILSDKTGSKV